MSSLDQIKVTFFVECRELLEEMEAGLIDMSEGSHDSETVNAVFRAAHSIKGGAGAFAFNDLVSFAHRFETTLDEVRAGRLQPDQEVMAVFLRAADRLADLVSEAESDTASDPAQSEELLRDLAELIGAPVQADTPNTPGFDDGGFVPMSLDLGDLGGSIAPEGGPFEVKFKPHPTLLTRGNEPALSLRALTELGSTQVTLHSDEVGPIDAAIDTPQLSWTVVIDGECSEEDIREVFEFVEDDCDLTIARLPAPTPPDPDDAEQVPLAEFTTAPASLPSEQQSPVAKANDTRPQAAGSIRVDLDRIDRLINLVGELVVNQAMLSQSVVDAGLVASSAVATGLDEFKNLTRDVQDSVMSIRAQPVRSLFQRMSRIVREAANATGKTVKLRTEGEGTEIDKTVIDMLADPLTHMIRNAVDHGLENPDTRRASGKPDEGTVVLSAAHRSGRVVIEIADDGAGINRDRVLEIAIAKGLVPPDAQFTPTEIDNLLFLPGFSTAQEVSNLSGRGVGMDVVKQAIQKLGGRIAIQSEPGVGSTFSISLPLTLAVLDGMMVGVDDQTLVVPLTSVVETLRPDAASIHQLGLEGSVIKVRDNYVPIIDTGKHLGFCTMPTPPDRKVYLLIDGEQAGPRALAVDTILDQRQVVIKSLEDNYGHVNGVAAATILGNGRIALILDPDALVPDQNTEAAA